MNERASEPRGAPESRRDNGKTKKKVRQAKVANQAQQGLAAAQAELASIRQSLLAIRAERGSPLAANVGKLKRELDAAEQHILAGIGLAAVVRDQQFRPDAHKSRTAAPKAAKGAAQYAARGKGLLGDKQGVAKSEFQAAAQAKQESLQKLQAQQAKKAQQAQQAKQQEQTAQSKSSRALRQASAKPAAAKGAMEARQGDAQRDFNQAVQPPVKPAVKPRASEQVKRDQPHPAPRPSWAADVDRAVHQNEMRRDGKGAAENSDFYQLIAQTLQERREMYAQPTLEQSFHQAHGMGRGR